MSSNNNWLPNKPLISEQNLKETSSTNSRNRRVNFVLNKNTAQGKASRWSFYNVNSIENFVLRKYNSE